MANLATLGALLRGLHLAAMLSLLGVVGCLAWVLPAAAADGREMVPALVRLWRVSGVAALLTLMAWFVSQSAAIAGAANLDELAAALPKVAEHTRYGGAILVRAGLLLAASLLAGRSRVRLYPVLVLIAVALGLQGLIGHAGAMAGSVGAGVMTSESLHLLAAGLWLGALLPLWLSVGKLPARAAAAVCDRFSPIGLACVMVIAGTGLAQGIELIGGVPALVGTPYGRFVLVKIVLFMAALTLAALNRLWLTDRLSRGSSAARHHLRLSLGVETLVGLAVILTAGFLASAVPGVHEQPVWPLPWRLSLASVNEDPDFRAAVIVSLVLMVVAALGLAAACLYRRFRIIALMVLTAIIALRGPDLELLTVQAYPTSFQTSSSNFAAASIVRGQLLFDQNCPACHGVRGDGQGVLASGLRIKPTDLTMPHLWEHSDGELLWWLTHGIDDPEGGLAMPGFPGLSKSDRWAVIDYIRAHNAALAMRRDTKFQVPVAAPALPLRCSGINASRTADLGGTVVHVVTEDLMEESPPVPPQPGVAIVTLKLRPTNADTGTLLPGSCVAVTPAAWQAYAILADLPPDKLPGTEFLIDPNGWLRAVHTPGSSGGWPTSDHLIAAVRGICASPIQQASEGDHEHRH